jgi:hypothetical protein
MKLALRNTKQAWAGLIFMGIGLFVIVKARDYDLGTATHMGPGYFPTMLAGMMTVLGLVALLQSLARADDAKVEHLDIVPVAFLVGGVVAFGLLIDSTGLVPALAALIALSCYRRLLRKPLEVLAIFAVITVATVGIFIYLIKLPIQAFVNPFS